MNSPILLRQPNLGWPVRKKWRVRLGIVVGLLKKQRSSDLDDENKAKLKALMEKKDGLS